MNYKLKNYKVDLAPHLDFLHISKLSMENSKWKIGSKLDVYSSLLWMILG